MQPLTIYHLRNLLCSHASILACKAVKYGFFNFHTSKLHIIQKQKRKSRNFFSLYLFAVFALLLEVLSIDIGQIVISVCLPLATLELSNLLEVVSPILYT